MTKCNAEDGEGRRGTFIFDETALPASLKDLPTIVECYKTYDDVNLVKTGDIGQVICQHQPPATTILHVKTQYITTVADATLPWLSSKLCKVWRARRRSQTHAHLQVILVGGKQNASIKARHGLTPPMRDAAQRMFDQTPAVDQKIMQKLEDDLLTIAQVASVAHALERWKRL